jgi:hypothetical protein
MFPREVLRLLSFPSKKNGGKYSACSVLVVVVVVGDVLSCVALFVLWFPVQA